MGNELLIASEVRPLDRSRSVLRIAFTRPMSVDEMNKLHRQINEALMGNAPEPVLISDDLYYLQLHGNYSGDSLLWWSEGKHGYTCDIKQAHVFTKEEAYLQHASRPEDRPWRKAYVDAHLQHHVSNERAKWKDAQ